MSGRHDPERPRYEHKYVATHEAARALVKDLEEAMVPDPESGTDGYQVRSLYFDTGDRAAYFEKLDGVDPRHKVRLRIYGDPSGAPRACFLEVKHRAGPLIFKDRLKLPGDALADLAEQGVLAPDLEVLSPLAAGAPASPGRARLERILASQARVPSCTVGYRRLAYMTRLDPSLRLTVDVDLRAAGPGAMLRPAADGGIAFLPADLCVVELKFHWATPAWLVSLFRAHGLVQRRYSKYASAMEALYPEEAHREVRRATTTY